MGRTPFRLTDATTSELIRLLRAQRAEDLSYPEQGATAGVLPSGYHHVHAEVELGRGDETFERAGAALAAWAPHRAAGIELFPSTPALVAGETLLLTFRTMGLHVVAAARVVWTVDEPDRRGFGYGTLPLHPESGEESFVMERAADGVVRFVITAFSRPATALTRLGGPVGRRVQAAVTRRYLLGMQRSGFPRSV